MHDQPTTHSVIACRGGASTAVERRPVPVPGHGELVLGLRVVGLCGTDLFKLDNDLAAPGTVLGHELVGEVIELGPGVEGFEVGDRVAVPHHVPCGTCELCRRGNETMCDTFRENLLQPGAFAERVLVTGRAVLEAARKLPENVSDQCAVFMEPAACVLRGVWRAALPDEGLVVIQGGGSMGLLHLLVLQAFNPALRTLVIDPDEHRRAVAKRLGASAACNAGESASTAVSELTGGLGADAVFDTVGGAGPLRAALALSRQGGTVILFAHAPDGQHADFDLNDLFKYERRVLGTYSGSVREQAEIFDWMVAGRFDPSPLATHELDLTDFAHGVELTRQRKALKVLYRPASDAGSAGT